MPAGVTVSTKVLNKKRMIKFLMRLCHVPNLLGRCLDFGLNDLG